MPCNRSFQYGLSSRDYRRGGKEPSRFFGPEYFREHGCLPSLDWSNFDPPSRGKGFFEVVTRDLPHHPSLGDRYYCGDSCSPLFRASYSGDIPEIRPRTEEFSFSDYSTPTAGGRQFSLLKVMLKGTGVHPVLPKGRVPGGISELYDKCLDGSPVVPEIRPSNHRRKRPLSPPSRDSSAFQGPYRKKLFEPPNSRPFTYSIDSSSTRLGRSSPPRTPPESYRRYPPNPSSFPISCGYSKSLSRSPCGSRCRCTPPPAPPPITSARSPSRSPATSASNRSPPLIHSDPILRPPCKTRSGAKAPVGQSSMPAVGSPPRITRGTSTQTSPILMEPRKHVRFAESAPSTESSKRKRKHGSRRKPWHFWMD
ncbi:hypothetical protein LOZ66_004101 [Ophidiomyces ophidiicola]|nr:hypothetical protein LOZ66_004101 [Ophidiomyces ophidiicola]